MTAPARVCADLVAPASQANTVTVPIVCAADSLAAHDYVLRGKTQLGRYTDENVKSALVSFQKAIEISPSYAEAHAWLAQCHTWQFAGWWSEDPDKSLQTAMELAQKAVEIRRWFLEPWHDAILRGFKRAKLKTGWQDQGHTDIISRLGDRGVVE